MELPNVILSLSKALVPLVQIFHIGSRFSTLPALSADEGFRMTVYNSFGGGLGVVCLVESFGFILFTLNEKDIPQVKQHTNIHNHISDIKGWPARKE